MTTIKTLALQTIRLLEGGGRVVDGDYDERVVMRHIRQAVASQIKADWVASREFGDLNVGAQMIGVFRGCEVQEDTEYEGRNYINLPGAYVNIYNGKGIQRVRPQTKSPSKNRAMIPINPFDMDLYEAIESGIEVLRGQFCWEPSRDRIYFTEKNDKTLLDEGIKKVEVTMVTIDPNTVGDNDNYPIPQDMEQAVIAQVLQLYGYTGQEVDDMLNDNNSTKRDKIDGRTVA